MAMHNLAVRAHAVLQHWTPIKSIFILFLLVACVLTLRLICVQAVVGAMVEVAAMVVAGTDMATGTAATTGTGGTIDMTGRGHVRLHTAPACQLLYHLSNRLTASFHVPAADPSTICCINAAAQILCQTLVSL
jgi:hypothetical protein